MSDTPTLYRRGDAWLYSDRIEDLVDEGVLVPVEPSSLAAVLVKHLPLISASQIVEVCNAFLGGDRHD